MISKRKRELDKQYAKAVRGADPAATRHEWRRLLAIQYQEDGDMEIFKELRRKPRINGARRDQEYMRGTLTAKQTFRQIKSKCADAYVSRLNRYGIANIDMANPAYRAITRNMALQVVHAFDGVDPDDKAAVCIPMARTWNQFVRTLHAKYGLPTVKQIQQNIPPESDAEKTVLDSNDFETRMTPIQKARWEAAVA